MLPVFRYHVSVMSASFVMLYLCEAAYVADSPASLTAAAAPDVVVTRSVSPPQPPRTPPNPNLRPPGQRGRRQTKLHVIALATCSGEIGLERMLRSAEAAGIVVRLLGLDSSDSQVSAPKLKALARFLERMWPTRVENGGERDLDVVLLVDAFDALFSPTASADHLLERFAAIGWPVVTAATSGAVSSSTKSVADSADSPNGCVGAPTCSSSPPLLDAGIVIGEVEALRGLLARHSWHDATSDTSWWNRVRTREPASVHVDGTWQIFASPDRSLYAADVHYHVGADDFSSAQLRLREGDAVQALHPNGSVVAEPLVLHFPGRFSSDDGLFGPAYRALFPETFSASQFRRRRRQPPLHRHLREPSTVQKVRQVCGVERRLPNANDDRSAAGSDGNDGSVLPLQQPRWAREQAAAEMEAAGRVGPGGFFGIPLREGPWRCTASSVWNERQAALCSGNGQEIVVDQVYVANLDSRTDRIRALQKELREHGLRAVRFPSVRGDGIPETEQERHKRTAHRTLPPGHLGCFFTHVALWREVAKKGWDVAWILEDDATFFPEELRTLPQRLEELRRVDREWHFAYTGRNPVEVSQALLLHEGVFKHWPDRRDQRRSAHVVDPGISEGLWGYLLSARGASVLVETFGEMLRTGIEYDVDFALHLERPRSVLRMYAFEPSLSGQRVEDSYSDTSAISRGRKRLLLGHQFLRAHALEEAESRLQGAVADLGGKGDLWEQEATRYLAAARAQLSKVAGDRASSEAEAGFRAAAALAERPDADPKEIRGTLADFCHFMTSQNRFQEAATLCQRSLDLSTRDGSLEGECTALEYLAILSHRRGKLGSAERFFRRAVEVTSRGVAGLRSCSVFTNLCVFLRSAGRRAEAEDACERCVALGHGLHATEILRQIRAETSASKK
eukprot:TRINITY_DN19476_c0_g1_i1.p1 TRINITY_DN19476_c0_g1~~TRINITY_DN19476_c0_g1_i1.p1  ORF type:complete len:907 (-),score=177.27 TRINITY_DN19476_c0_g1_i1:63-2783(-)